MSAAPARRSSDEIAAESLELLCTIVPQIQEISTETAHARRKRLMELNFLQGNVYTNPFAPPVSSGSQSAFFGEPQSFAIKATPPAPVGTDTTPRSASPSSKAIRKARAEAIAKIKAKKDDLDF